MTSRIEWTESTWNPVTGCTKISAGCEHCYAERMAKRLHGMGQPRYRNGFQVTLHPDVLSYPLDWKRPQMVFVNSMSDLFHNEVPLRFIRRVFDVMQRAERHTFQVLTKRAERLERLAAKLPWPDNVWMGVTVESAEYLHRLDALCEVPAAVRFVSFEPLLSGVTRADLTGIDWVIVGGESGPGARPMQPAWARDIRDRCMQPRIPFFFKQWGGFNKKAKGRELDGRTWDEWPRADNARQEAYGRRADQTARVSSPSTPRHRDTERHAPQLV
jgi:protein gp37